MTDRPQRPADDVEGHRLAANDNETVVEDPDRDETVVEDPDGDVEAHRLASNDNETLIDDR